CSVPEAEMPVWFKNGVKAAMMAPTAINQQKFMITLDGDEAVITTKGGPMTKIDYSARSAHAPKCVRRMVISV
ncbi:MAG: hypothetical protein J5943_00220, partial [Oribacterium sp.]|nr:hypothetical protein [Oribacterium sp.]